MTIPEISHHPFDTEEDARLAGQIVYKLLRKRVLGSHKKQITTVAGWFPTHKQGQVKTLLETMARKPGVPVTMYGGGHRNNVQLVAFEPAMQFADRCGADTEWIPEP